MKVRHVGITITDLEKSIWFYEEILGFKTVKEMDESGDHIDKFSGLDSVDVRTVKMKGSDGSMIELLHYRSHPEVNTSNLKEKINKIGCSHFALTVPDLGQLYDKLIDNSCFVMCEPQPSPDGKVMLTFCRDPDGSLIELVEEL
jgi:catechol 2,3-dioxygenase-like lactoylglutathione lyase family enzyme